MEADPKTYLLKKRKAIEVKSEPASIADFDNYLIKMFGDSDDEVVKEARKQALEQALANRVAANIAADIEKRRR